MSIFIEHRVERTLTRLEHLRIIHFEARGVLEGRVGGEPEKCLQMRCFACGYKFIDDVCGEQVLQDSASSNT